MGFLDRAGSICFRRRRCLVTSCVRGARFVSTLLLQTSIDVDNGGRVAYCAGWLWDGLLLGSNAVMKSGDVVQDHHHPNENELERRLFRSGR